MLRWRAASPPAADAATGPGRAASNDGAARQFDVSICTVQRVRQTGQAGLRNSPATPVVCTAALTSSSNGHAPVLPATS
ncbi:hypothetical protein [Dactylosporangium salmoneum]|uniref:Uncharacterized protein n=1 Tax=Dactylosporangium salmoneum TaxID=53361 RepID=A0ABP5TCU3_9ACTN